MYIPFAAKKQRWTVEVLHLDEHFLQAALGSAFLAFLQSSEHSWHKPQVPEKIWISSSPKVHVQLFHLITLLTHFPTVGGFFGADFVDTFDFDFLEPPNCLA